ncbi:MAG: VWA domain-containing protein [Rhodobacterales bacterium]|nr:VWA domain-containing protein [Rhodobacterales bacterium]
MRLSPFLLVALLLPLMPAFDAAAQAVGDGPLLAEGKTSIFQRVLSRPGAELSVEPKAGTGGTPIPPFTVFYVYARQAVDGTDWVEVGPASRRPTQGWIPADKLIDWKQTVSVTFTNPSGRERTLLFRDRQKLLDLLESETLTSQANDLRQQALAGPVAPDFPVVSIEPAVHVDIKDQFYLLPILSWEEIYLDSGFTTRLLEIASVTREDREEETLDDARTHAAIAAGIGEREQAIADYRTGVVFVVDTTTSMGPYIDRTREAVRAVYDSLAAENLLGRVSFGLVAYRDNTGASPGLEYVSKTFADLKSGGDPTTFLADVSAVAPATVSSKGFDEDAFSGLKRAIETLDWEPYGGRFIVLITDAGARQGADPLSSTGMDAAQIRRLAADKRIAVLTLHLLTEEGKADHAKATAQYSELSAHESGDSLYFSVPAGAVDQFGRRLGVMTAALTDQIKRASGGHVVDAPPADSQVITVPPPPPAPPLNVSGAGTLPPVNGATPAGDGAVDPELNRLDAATDRVGHAMQLAYLGKKEGTKAPTLFEAFVSDRDLSNPDTVCLDVRVLISKTQLSDLQQAMQTIVEAGRLAQLSPEDFFDQLRGAAAAMSRDPSRVAAGEGRTIADLGLIDEFIADLPYKSKVLNIDQDLWLGWSVGEQEAFINEIESKIKLYESYHDDTGRWVALDGGRIPGDAVYPVPLEALP